ncbi:MAG: DMT family transporter [Burkholderiales bacterium]|nr:DMT family transporter [Burkholderiales bacterium]
MYRSQNRGIIAGILAGVFWGTPFLVPMVLANFSGLEITFGRFFFFGLISLLSLPKLIRLVRSLTIREMLQIIILSATGFWLYSLILFMGVRESNGIIASLIIGSLPVTVTLFSRPIFNRRLIIGLIAIIFGLGCLLIYPLIFRANLATLSQVSWHGIIYLLIALVMWSWFAIANSRFMAKHTHIRSLDYSSLIGVVSFIFILPIFAVWHRETSLLVHPELVKFILWSTVLGVGASWIANIFWAYSAKNCPPSIGGSLIISETVFGLVYSFIFEQRWPLPNELIAIVSLIVGVIVVIKSQRGMRH